MGDYAELMAIVSISIHAPREGGDVKVPFALEDSDQFQSTPPARGATANTDKRERLVTDISIHAPREGGDRWIDFCATLRNRISIHAPREGGDCCQPAPPV